MALRSDIKYIGDYIISKLAIGTFLPVTASSGATEIRILNDEIFEPSGGQLLVADTDRLITYTSIATDVLKGVPPTGTGSINADLRLMTDDDPTILMIPNLVSIDEIETAIDKYRRYRTQIATPTQTKDLYLIPLGWLGDVDDSSDETVELRTTPTADYTVVVEDDRDTERGEFEFDAAQTYDVLYAVGWFYNPFNSIAEIIDTLVQTGRWHKVSAAGELRNTKRDAADLALYWRKRGAALNF